MILTVGLRVISLTSAGIASYFCGSYLQNWSKNSLIVRANIDELLSLNNPTIDEQLDIAFKTKEGTPSMSREMLSDFVRLGFPTDRFKFLTYEDGDTITSYDNSKRVPSWILQFISDETVTIGGSDGGGGDDDDTNMTPIDYDECRLDPENRLSPSKYCLDNKYVANYLVSPRIKKELKKSWKEGTRRKGAELCRIQVASSSPNMVPQAENLNCRWPLLECYSKNIAQKCKNVLILSGTLFLPKNYTIGEMLDDNCTDIEETPDNVCPKEEPEECPKKESEECPKEESEECPKEESEECPEEESEKCPEEECEKCPEEESEKCPEEETEECTDEETEECSEECPEEEDEECPEEEDEECPEEESTCTLVHSGPPPPEPIKYEVINGKVSIPTHFFKMIMYDHDTEPDVKCYKAYVIPNDVNKELCDNWQRFSISLEELEQVSGLEIFSTEYKERLRREMDG